VETGGKRSKKTKARPVATVKKELCKRGNLKHGAKTNKFRGRKKKTVLEIEGDKEKGTIGVKGEGLPVNPSKTKPDNVCNGGVKKVRKRQGRKMGGGTTLSTRRSRGKKKRGPSKREISKTKRRD